VGCTELEVADVFRRHGAEYRQAHAGMLGRAQLRVMRAIELCRTAALGGHVEQCDACAHRRVFYNSCLTGKFINGELVTGSLQRNAARRQFRSPLPRIPE